MPPPQQPESSRSEVTRLLERVAAGDRTQLERLLELVYEELRNLARIHLRNERADHTLQPTALVHEAFLRLVDQRAMNWHNRAHFFGSASNIIRRVLIDHARARASRKRGAHRARMTLTSAHLAQAPAAGVDLLALDEAMQLLAQIDPRQARIVELRFFGGLSVEETAALLGLGKRTIDREWQCARIWLFHELRDGERSPFSSPEPADGSGQGA